MPPILAETDFSFLIYLIVGAFWLFGNLLQAKQKAQKKKAGGSGGSQGQRPTGKTRMETELEEFLGRLSGEPAAPPPQVSPPRRREAEIQFDGPAPSPPAPPATRKPAPAPAAAKSSNIGELDLASSFKQISDIKEAKELIGAENEALMQQDALTQVRSMMVDLSASRVSMPLIPMQSIRAVQTKTDRPDLKQKQVFKKALVASVILDTPKALKPNPFQETP